MIFDHLENLEKYCGIPYLNSILEFISNTKIFDLREGDIAIKDDDLFVKVLRYTPKPSQENYFETHKNYADLQIVFDGVEAMHIVDSNYLEKSNEVKMEGDFTFYIANNHISELVLEKEKFVLLFPGEPHKPGCIYNSIEEPVLKLVFKIKLK